MKIITIACVISVLLVFSQAGAETNTVYDFMGLYFDTNADMFCLDSVAPYTVHNIYLALGNPTAEAIQGLRAGVGMDGSALFLSSTIPGDITITDEYVEIDYIWPDPIPTSPVTILVTFGVFYMAVDGSPVDFYLGDLGDPIDGFPSYMLPDGTWVEAQLTEYALGNLVAYINTGCVTPTEAFTFDSLKSLYR
jgi:hypothetical protein